jgi:hypothetical protein
MLNTACWLENNPSPEDKGGGVGVGKGLGLEPRNCGGVEGWDVEGVGEVDPDEPDISMSVWELSQLLSRSSFSQKRPIGVNLT